MRVSIEHLTVRYGAVLAVATVVGVRPEDVRIGLPGVSGRVRLLENLGREVLVHLEVDGSQVRALAEPRAARELTLGASIDVSVAPDRWHYFDGAPSARIDPPRRTNGLDLNTDTPAAHRRPSRRP